ncbi:ABC transporter substrate-binding protein [Spartinivicinus poritis]|uniref:ABC transporter substrate-binding protein n=1 Tax=Spartinivicinus poritis TaxID=2994640 RepID=A0ABT5U772_9GAMM|nr:ABC transporter substrate-binding protein [Spartinivicinus sp. A2-2]MDE1462217.1 ABC transporter substrate-binding protein [Spartinivicinus sp. A2-2]
MKKLLFFLCLTMTLANTVQAKECEIDKKIRFAGMNWLSNQITVEIERFILEKGYGCKTTVETGDTLPMLAAISRGDVDIMSEVWINSVSEAWNKAVKEGQVKSLGDVYTGGIEGWFIPKYLAKKYPDLKSVSDLPKYKHLFKDREAPGKGRFYSCPIGWACEVINQNLIKAFQLEDQYNVFSPGTGAALKAAITSHYKRRKPILFYYWAPTAVLGKFDMVKLTMPPYDKTGHICNTNPECTKPYPGNYPIAAIKTGIHTDFAKAAPQLVDFISKVKIPTQEVNKLLAWADEEGAESTEVAHYFLKNYESLWTQWVPGDVAKQVKAAL